MVERKKRGLYQRPLNLIGGFQSIDHRTCRMYFLSWQCKCNEEDERKRVRRRVREGEKLESSRVDGRDVLNDGRFREYNILKIL